MGNTRLTALLFSGGIDSTAVAWWLRPDKLLTVDYGQRTACSEISAATEIGRLLEIPHYFIRLDLSGIGGGSLVGKAPSSFSEHAEWWPFRNQFLVTIGSAWALSNGVGRLMMGTVKSDCCFADGTHDFFDSMSKVLRMQEGNLELDAPALELDSATLVTKSGMATKNLLLCHSCSVSDYQCGMCRSCLKYRSVLDQFGLL